MLKLVRELAGGENLLKVKGAASKILAASWLMISAILNAPEGGRPSEGLAALAEKGVLPRAIFDRLRPIFEELDTLLGTVSREDKALLVGKIVDYDGYVEDGLLKVKAKAIKEMPVELDGVGINMADVAEAAAKAFSEEGEWRGVLLSFGPARDVPELKVDEKAPLKAPTFKAMAALIAQEARKEADQLRRRELVEYGEPIKFKGGGAEIEITPAKAKEEQVPITLKNLEEIWKGFEGRRYTHLGLAVSDEEYELFGEVEGRSGGRAYVRFIITGKRALRLAEALRGLGLNVEPTPSGYLLLRYEHLKALLDKGVKAYTVRKAKMGEAMWRVEITYRGMTMVLKMSYNERDNCLVKVSRTGKIEAIVYEEGAAEGKRVELDLNLLAAIREGRADCKDCLEKQLAEMLDTTASKNPDFGWSVTGKRVKALIIKPPNFKDAVRRFYSE